MAYGNGLRWVAPLGLTLALLSGHASSARADENAEARVFFEQGNRHLERALRARGSRRTRLLEQALSAYVESLRVVRSRNAIFNAAVTLEELGRLEEAFGYLTEYLAFAGLSDAETSEAQSRLDGLRPRVAVVAVSSLPPGAEVRVDRRDLASRGVTPLQVAVPEGAHSLFLSLDGYDDVQVRATASTGQLIRAHQQLQPTPVPVTVRAPETGILTIDGNPLEPGQEIRVAPGRHVIRFEPAVTRTIDIRPGDGPIVIDLSNVEQPGGPRGTLTVSMNVPGRVSVDGTVVGDGPEIEVDLSSGPHQIRVEAPGHAPAEGQIDVAAGGLADVEVQMEPIIEETTTLGVLPVVFWVSTGVAALATVGLAARAFSLSSEYEDDATTERYQQVEDANTLADAVGIGTVALGLTALGLSLANEDVEQPRSTVILGAAPLPSGGMVMAEVPWGTP